MAREMDAPTLFRIMIVDDEPFVRNGMAQNVAWESCGFQLVAACENGREALERVPETMPDVVITDICMPFMDGLELARQLAAHYPHIHTVILTGFDQFEYAREAVKLQVRDFILKPVTRSELHPVLAKLHAELAREREAIDDRARLLRQVTESRPLLRERFLNRLAAGSLSGRELEQGADRFGIPLEGRFMQAAAIAVDDPEGVCRTHPDTGMDLWQFAVCNITGEIAGGEAGGVVFQNPDGVTLLWMSDDDPARLEERLLMSCAKVQGLIAQHLSFTVTVGIGQTSVSAANLPVSLQEAVRALEYRFVVGDGAIIPIRDREVRTDRANAEFQEIRRRLRREMRTGTKGDVADCIRNAIAELRGMRLDPARAGTLLRHLLTDFADAMEELTGDTAGMWIDLVGWHAELDRMHDLGAAEDWFLDLCRRGMDRISVQRGDLAQSLVVQAEQIVRERYGEEDLSLQTVLRALSVSSSYFSSIFKQRTGATFIEYLTRFRITKAMEWMKATPMKNYEIAEKVGLPDPQYFSTLFRKTSGMTPSEFRERMKS